MNLSTAHKSRPMKTETRTMRQIQDITRREIKHIMTMVPIVEVMGAALTSAISGFLFVFYVSPKALNIGIIC